MDLKVSNIVVSGDIDKELDLPEFDNVQKNGWEMEYKDIIPLGLTVIPPENKPKINLHNSGSYIIRGSDKSEIQETNKEFILLLKSMGVIEDITNPDFEIKNIVGTLTLDSQVNLHSLNQDNPETQYEPEVFAAVTVRKNNYACNIFESGKIVIQGAKDKAELKSAAEEIESFVQPYTQSTNSLL